MPQTKEANLEGPMASKLLHQLSKAQTEEDKEAIKASLVSISLKATFKSTDALCFFVLYFL